MGLLFNLLKLLTKSAQTTISVVKERISQIDEEKESLPIDDSIKERKEEKPHSKSETEISDDSKTEDKTEKIASFKEAFYLFFANHFHKVLIGLFLVIIISKFMDKEVSMSFDISLSEDVSTTISFDNSSYSAERKK